MWLTASKCLEKFDEMSEIIWRPSKLLPEIPYFDLYLPSPQCSISCLAIDRCLRRHEETNTSCSSCVSVPGTHCQKSFLHQRQASSHSLLAQTLKILELEIGQLQRLN